MSYLRHGYGGHHDKGVMAPTIWGPLAVALGCANVPQEPLAKAVERNAMAWTTPVLVEICIGLEINGYLPAEF